MNGDELTRLLETVVQGRVPVAEAVERLKQGPFRNESSPFATPDFHRRLRLGLAEVVYGERKTVSQIVDIVGRLSRDGSPVLITRLEEDRLDAVQEALPGMRINSAARTAIAHAPAPKDASSGEPFVAVVSGGTSDAPVVEEACEVCVAMNVAFEKVTDVGVAGLHRITHHLPTLRESAVVVVVAGMDGALPSVVGGLVGRPVIGVPTSVGYGASFGGISALLTMLNSCAPGVTVTNIDNGFSAAVAACNIVRVVLEMRGSHESGSSKSESDS